MAIRGKIQDGVAVLLDGATLPDGTEVEITPRDDRAQPGSANGATAIWAKLHQLAQAAEAEPCDLPEDLARNHDHYLHGLPKRP